MGGSIGITLRESNGTEHRMCRWTNVVPWTFDNLDFTNKDEAHISQFLTAWDEMVADYKRKDFEKSPMSEVYVPYGGLYPTEYGLIVADFTTNTLLDMNDYHAIGKTSTIHIRNEIQGVLRYQMDRDILLSPVEALVALTEDEPDSNCYTTLQFVKEGKVKQATKWDFSLEKHVPISVEITNVQQLADFVMDPEHEFSVLKLDMSPFTLKTFERTLEGSQQLRQEVLNLGFVLTDEEVKAWDEFDSDHFGDE